jgi:GNAT superfamily N-acetyltransferase
MEQVTLTIKQCSVSDIEAAPQFPKLIEEYAEESAIDGLPPPQKKIDQYKQIESGGALFPLGAWLGDCLIGFAAVLMPVIPHYGVCVAVTESLFVAKEFRGTGAGIKLIREAERIAREGKSPGLLVSAGVNSPLVIILPRSGYVETNRVFFRKNPDA